MTITALVGNPRPGSRTRTAAEHTARRLAQRAASTTEPGTIELADLGPALLEPTPPPAVEAALERARDSDLLVVATPTYKATYTGLLKVFLDLLPGGGLSEVTAVPLMVMASPAHTLAVEVHLRPLLLELGADVPFPGLAIDQNDIPKEGDAADAPLDGVLTEWLERVHPALFPATPPVHRADVPTVG
ncbi:NAD(P)H-dependent oxidoreductase [Nocardiopsis sp. HNM0947]|uniref:NAD(P)H-dependent oxidoreductase n=1 Tax=Nocardiopsis coralli TaxID=2772213 RepID=A0ABR9PAG7_9ACTN|nr:NADPH-dependent FMN reductase [Nocardiopsis coralli]MBE3000824.1 NAD(P)H-dependent oxidoreductase [Nocardiopsis coralli]